MFVFNDEGDHFKAVLWIRFGFSADQDPAFQGGLALKNPPKKPQKTT
jgi:hypothetical protein